MKKDRMARSTCAATDKRRYSSYFEARAAAREIADAAAEDHGKPYRCEACGGWHLGRAREP